jgi:hypothetical protein
MSAGDSNGATVKTENHNRNIPSLKRDTFLGLRVTKASGSSRAGLGFPANLNAHFESRPASLTNAVLLLRQ